MERFATSIAVVGLISCLALPGAAFAIGLGDGGDDTDARFTQAVEAVEKQDYKQAISLLRQVLQDDSGHADALNYMGYSHRRLGDYERALTYYQRALQVNPDHEGANEYIGEAYLELKQPDRAKAHLDRLAKICGTACGAYRDLKEAFDAYQAKAAGN